jgi:hypothetical protein
LGAAVAFTKKQRFVSPFVLLPILFIAILVVHPFSSARADGLLHIDFLDVGQGDAR